MNSLLLLLTTFLATAALGQTPFVEQLANHRETYKKDLLKSAGGPLASEEDLSFVQFYAPDSTYRVTATVQLTPKAEPFEMPTYNGMTRPHVSYALLSFVLNGKPSS
ncbi:DUF1684 domain-containing protein [Spirosoma telluris]|uniref:DUF1684 domain-containing protein n=1 Tax=Spirosoma telluris TaxID=2183553 RepID=UPI002FC397F2